MAPASRIVPAAVQCSAVQGQCTAIPGRQIDGSHVVHAADSLRRGALAHRELNGFTRGFAETGEDRQQALARIPERVGWNAGRMMSA